MPSQPVTLPAISSARPYPLLAGSRSAEACFIVSTACALACSPDFCHALLPVREPMVLYIQPFSGNLEGGEKKSRGLEYLCGALDVLGVAGDEARVGGGVAGVVGRHAACFCGRCLRQTRCEVGLQVAKR